MTAYVPTNRQARSATVRMTNATAAWAAARMPGRSGVSGEPWVRAARTTTYDNAAAEATWAITEPMAEPAMPRAGIGPRPKTSTKLRAMLSPLPPIATSSGVRVSWRPRRIPVVASMISSGVVPKKAIRR